MTSIFPRPKYRSSQDLSCHYYSSGPSSRSSSPDHPIHQTNSMHASASSEDIYGVGGRLPYAGSRSVDPVGFRPGSRGSNASQLYHSGQLGDLPNARSSPSSPRTSPRGSPRDGTHQNGSSGLLRTRRTMSIDMPNMNGGANGEREPSDVARQNHATKFNSHLHKSPHHHSLQMDELKDRLASSNSEGDLEKFLCQDATAVSEQLRSAYHDVHKEFRVPSVLLVGCTGSGKSSLVNEIFGTSLAETGTGRPITQHYTRYKLDGKPIIFYDSKGLEVGYDFEDVMADTKSFLMQHGPDSQDPVHVIWYVINTASSRVQPFEEKLWAQLCENVPMIMLLNKADISSEQDRQHIRDRISELNLSGIVGVFDCIADPRHRPPARPECPRCNKDDITVRRRTNTMKCDICGYTGPLPSCSGGLEQVVRATAVAMSDHVAVTFIASQRLSYDLKEKQSRVILLDHYRECQHARRSATLMRSMSKMLSRLSILWEFKQHSKVCASAMAKQLCGHLSLRDRLLLFMSAESTMVHESVALGIMWASSVRRLRTILLYGTVPVASGDDSNANQDDPIQMLEKSLSFAFELFTQQTMDRICHEMAKESVPAYLNRPDLFF